MADLMAFRVVLESIEADGSQRFVAKGTGKVTYLCGWNRAQNVSPGATGYLEYRVGPTCGLYWFVPDKEASDD